MMANPASMLQQPAARGPRKKSPEDEQAELASYRDRDGWLCFPALGVRNAIIDASGMHRSGRRSLKTFVNHIQIDPIDYLTITNSKGKKLKEFEIDTRRAVNKLAGAIMVSRPIVRDWRLAFALQFDPQLIPSDPRELFAMLLDDAGTRIGIGAYRPAKGGWFGRFTVE
jgi:hypothetical protein